MGVAARPWDEQSAVRADLQRWTDSGTRGHAHPSPGVKELGLDLFSSAYAAHTSSGPEQRIDTALVLPTTHGNCPPTNGATRLLLTPNFYAIRGANPFPAPKCQKKNGPADPSVPLGPFDL